MKNLALSIAALIPAITLCLYIYKKDSVEKEPLKLLGALFFTGAIVFFPVHYIENTLITLVDKLFFTKMEFNVSGILKK